MALVLLVVITLIGLGAARMSTSQERMTANFYDRGIAFQNAEAALRAGAASIPVTATGVRNCGRGGVSCLVNPFADAALPAGSIKTVTTGAYTKSDNAASQPQYVVENLGNDWISRATSTGFDQTANSAQYGAQGSSLTTSYYRVTGRSGDPADIGERSLVVLQAIYRQ